MISRTGMMGNPHRAANAWSSGSLAMVPSSFMISQSTPAGYRPARAARSTAASVWPARRRTPPGVARRGNTWPGRERSSGRVAGSTRALMVAARSWAEMPVVILCFAPTDTVKAVPWWDVLWLTMTNPPRRMASTASSTVAKTARDSARSLIGLLRGCDARPLLRSSGMHIGGGHPLDVLGHDVGLHVHLAPCLQVPQGGGRARVGNEAHGEPPWTNPRHREAHPVHRYGPLLDQIPGHPGGSRDLHPHRVSLGPAGEDASHAVDVSLHEMAAETPSHGESSLQVHEGAPPEPPQGRALQGLRGEVRLEHLSPDRDGREAHAVDGNALAVPEAVAPWTRLDDDPPGTALSPEVTYDSRPLHKPCKHQLAS